MEISCDKSSHIKITFHTPISDIMQQFTIQTKLIQLREYQQSIMIYNFKLTQIENSLKSLSMETYKTTLPPFIFLQKLCSLKSKLPTTGKKI